MVVPKWQAPHIAIAASKCDILQDFNLVIQHKRLTNIMTFRNGSNHAGFGCPVYLIMETDTVEKKLLASHTELARPTTFRVIDEVLPCVRSAE